MRGTFIVSGVEIVIEVAGEQWQQGQPVNVSGTMKSHGQIPDISSWSMRLIKADSRKVKKKDPKAFETLEEFQLSQADLSSPHHFEHTFHLKEDAPISDGTWTLALQIGPGDDPYSSGMLNLTVTPWFAIDAILETFENFKRFKKKSLKNKMSKKKDRLEAKMLPPGSKELGGVEGLDLLIEREESGLILDFNFKVKKLAYAAGGVEAKADKVSIKKELKGKDLLMFGDSLNQDKVLACFDEVLEQVKTNFI
jgi:hypothetical protein